VLRRRLMSAGFTASVMVAIVTSAQAATAPSPRRGLLTSKMSWGLLVATAVGAAAILGTIPIQHREHPSPSPGESGERLAHMGQSGGQSGPRPWAPGVLRGDGTSPAIEGAGQSPSTPSWEPGGRRSILGFDFEDGRRPEVVVGGHVVRTAGRPGSEYN